MVRSPFHLRGELSSGGLDVIDNVAGDGIRMHHELRVIRTGNETARAAVLVVQLLTGSGINKQRSSYCVLVKLIKV